MLGASVPSSGGVTDRAFLRTGAAWSLGGHGVNALAWLATTAVASRALGPGAFGSFLALASAVVLVSCLGRLGTDRAVVHETGVALAAGDGEAARAAATRARRTAAAGGAALAALVVSPIGALALEQVAPEQSLGLRVALAVWLLAEVLRLPLVETVRAWSRVRAAAAVGEALRSSTILVAVTAVAIREASPTLTTVVAACAGATVVAALTAGAVAAVTAHQPVAATETLPARVPRPPGRGWTVLADGSAQVLAQGDVWIAAAVLGPAAAGEYGAAVRLALLPALFLPVASASFAPLAARLDAVRDGAALQHAATHVARLATGAALVVLGAYAVAGGWLLRTLFGAPAEDALPVLLWLSLGQVVNAAAGPCGMLLLVTGRQRAAAVRFAAVAVAVAVIGVGAADVAGAAALALVSGAATALVNVLLARAARGATGVRTDVLATGAPTPAPSGRGRSGEHAV